jgi:RNA polymerase sigma-70 factor (ECF subfamily)
MASVDQSALADVESFVALYREHAEGLLAFFARRTLDGEAAADLTAETFAQALASRQRFRDHGEGAGPWLYAIASHQLAHYYRRGRGRASAKARERLGMPARAELSQEDLQRIEELIDLGAVAGEVRRAMAALPASLRDAVALRIVEAQPYSAIAAELGCTEQAARLRVSRALRRLATTIQVTEG